MALSVVRFELPNDDGSKIFTGPAISKVCVGLAVPMPTLPLLATMKLVPVDDPTTKLGAEPFETVGLTESCPQGELVPIPTKPLSSAVMIEVEALFKSENNAEEPVSGPWTVKVACGVVVPIAIEPAAVEVPELVSPVPYSRFPIFKTFELVKDGVAMLYPSTMLLLPEVVEEAAW